MSYVPAEFNDLTEDLMQNILNQMLRETETSPPVAKDVKKEPPVGISPRVAEILHGVRPNYEEDRLRVIAGPGAIGGPPPETPQVEMKPEKEEPQKKEPEKPFLKKRRINW